MKTCPFFGKCGGCKFDFASDAYRDDKRALLQNLPINGDIVWGAPGARRRGDFAFAAGRFGMFQHQSKNIIPVQSCPNMVPEINNILPALAGLPWCGAGACLVTACDNGIDICITSNVPFFDAEFKRAAEKVNAIRITWNGKVLKQTAMPMIKFGDKTVEYPSGAFLQPTVNTENAMRDMVVRAASGCHRVADLFCGLGNFTFALNADGFDIMGTGARRDLFKTPLTVNMLNTYDCVVMDPPRSGALAQCKELIKSNVRRIIYVSCNPETWSRDKNVLTRGGYVLQECIPVDQFVGSSHWEIFSVFEK